MDKLESEEFTESPPEIETYRMENQSLMGTFVEAHKTAYEEAVKLLKYTVIDEVPPFTELPNYGKGGLKLHPTFQMALDESMEGVSKEGQGEYDLNPQKWIGKSETYVVSRCDYLYNKVLECGGLKMSIPSFANVRFRHAKFEAVVWQSEKIEELRESKGNVSESDVEKVVKKNPPNFPELGFPHQVERFQNEEDYSPSELPNLMYAHEVD